MKKTNLFKTVLLLCALVVGSGSAWADTVTFTAGTDTSDGTSITKGGITITFSSGVFNRSDNYRCYSGASMTISSSVGNMTQIDFTATGSNPMTKFSGDPNVGSWTDDDKTQWTGNASTIDFGTTSGQCRMTQIVVTYTAAAKTDPTITFSNGSVRVGKTLDLSTLFTSNSSGAVTYSITSGGSNASLDGSTLTGVAEGSVTVKAEQAAAGSYNAGEASATITVNPALTLTGIAITTAPTKTTYTEGETFDPAGMVVTATYSDESTDDVTASCSYSPSGALSTSDTEITVSYTEVVTKTATQAITVNEVVDYAVLPFEWEGGASADLMALAGVTVNADNSDYAASNSPYLVKFNGTGKYVMIKTDSQPGQVSIEIKKLGGANTSTLTIEESANGEDFTSVEDLYTPGATNAIVNLTTTKLFKPESRYVRIYFTKEYAGATGSNIGVGPITITGCETVSVGESKYASFCSTSKLDFSETTVKAYTAKVEGSVVVLESVDEVPANTGVILYGEEGNYSVPVATSADPISNTNELVGVTSDTEVVYSSNDKYNYILQSGTFKKANGGTLRANRAYLSTSYDVTSVGAHELQLVFDDGETTGIKTALMNNEVKNNEVYNLNGQRVNANHKGIVIVNGKKYFNK